MPRWYNGAYPKVYESLAKLVPRFPPNLHLLPVYATDFTMFETGERSFLFVFGFFDLVLLLICKGIFCACYLVSFFLFPDGRHFKPVYGKDLVDFLVTNADQLMAELEKPTDERLSTHQNRSTCLQGQIDLIRSHQASQDLRINYAVAREAEDSDGRLNERFVFNRSFVLSVSGASLV